jgi:hypothetical protein
MALPPLAAQCIAVNLSSSSERTFGSAPAWRMYPSTSSDPCSAAIMVGVRRFRSRFLTAPRDSGTNLFCAFVFTIGEIEGEGTSERVREVSAMRPRGGIGSRSQGKQSEESRSMCYAKSRHESNEGTKEK